MKRATLAIASIAITLVGLIALIGVCIVGFVLFLWSITGPKPEAVLALAEPACMRIAVALEEFHRIHGRYPKELSDLVNEGILTKVPELPDHHGASFKRGPIYEICTSLDFYRLSFGYHVEGGMGPGDIHWRFLISDDSKGWRTAGLPEKFENLVANRALTTYRERGDEKSLSVFMKEVIGKADCDSLYRDRIVRWLGKGIEVDLPYGISENTKYGYLYFPINFNNYKYVFTYKNKLMPVFNGRLPASEDAKHQEATGEFDNAFVNKNFPVLDKLFFVHESENGPKWVVIRECPEETRH